MNVKVLYEDNHIIAVVKPAGVLAQGDKSGDVSIFDQVKVYLKEKYHKPGRVFLGLLHRLDRPVFGIMLFAKTSKGASRLSEQFRNRQVGKTYHALVSAKPKQQQGTLVNDDMVLHYEVVKPVGKYVLLMIQIEGGKYHQIRRQLSSAGMPIVGDVKYGGEKWHHPKAIALAATGISFTAATAAPKGGEPRPDGRVDNFIDLAIAIPLELGDNQQIGSI